MTRSRRTPALAALLAAGLIAGFGAGARSTPPSAAAAESAQPNVLVVMTDDETYRDAAYMPNFQRLADRGTAFTNAFVSFPICCPARATFLTGQYAHNHGVKSNFLVTGGGFESLTDQDNTLPVWLQQAGYRTGFAGKYLNEYGGSDPHLIPPGWDDWHGLVDYSTYNYFNWAINNNGELRYYGDRDYADALIDLAHAGVSGGLDTPAEGVAKALDLFQPFEYFGSEDQADYQIDVVGQIADRSLGRLAGGEQPFFYWYTPTAPHREGDFEGIGGVRVGHPKPDPRPPERYEHEFDDVPLPRDPSFNEADVSDKPETVSERPLLDQETIDTLTENHHGRLGALLAADDAVGRMLRTLRRSGELDNTLIVYTTDQGFFQGQHRIAFDKYLPYDEAIRVPLVMAGPGVPKGEVVRDPVYNQDLAPTILDAAGAEPGRTQDGVSLLPRLAGEKLPPRALLLEALAPALPFDIGNPVFDHQVPFYGVRTDRWKYVKWSFGAEELYDMRRDPYELDNLAEDPNAEAVETRLADLAQRLRGCSGPDCLGLSPTGPGGGAVVEVAGHQEPSQATGIVIIAALALAAVAGIAAGVRRLRTP